MPVYLSQKGLLILKQNKSTTSSIEENPHQPKINYPLRRILKSFPKNKMDSKLLPSCLLPIINYLSKVKLTAEENFNLKN